MIGVIRWAFRITQTVMVVLFPNGGSIKKRQQHKIVVEQQAFMSQQ
jgi:hypothetical protein